MKTKTKNKLTIAALLIFLPTFLQGCAPPFIIPKYEKLEQSKCEDITELLEGEIGVDVEVETGLFDDYYGGYDFEAILFFK